MGGGGLAVIFTPVHAEMNNGDYLIQVIDQRLMLPVQMYHFLVHAGNNKEGRVMEYRYHLMMI